MAKIILISCTSRKRDHKAKAKYLYDKSAPFRRSLAYAMLLNPDKIFILSAKHHLLNLESEIEPYDVTLSYVSKENRTKKPNLKVLSKKERKEWAKKVISQLRKVSDLDKDEFIFLAGKRYRDFLLPHIKHYDIPMKHINMFNQPAWLDKQIEKLKKKNER